MYHPPDGTMKTTLEDDFALSFLTEENARLRETLQRALTELTRLRRLLDTGDRSRANPDAWSGGGARDGYGDPADGFEAGQGWSSQRNTPIHDIPGVLPPRRDATPVGGWPVVRDDTFHAGSPLGAPLTAQEAVTRDTPAPVGPGVQGGVDLGMINQVSEEALNQLPYGLIVLDSEGGVLFYNETEARLTGFRREKILGRNFFRDVAPCARVQAFEGNFQAFVRGELGPVHFFDFAFHFQKGTQLVQIGFSQGRRRGQVNVMLMRR
jgi:photoactive yellow protein